MSFLKKINFNLVFVAVCVVSLFVGIYYANAVSEVESRLTGYAWSSNVGWLSFNDGGVVLDSNNALIGYAWSSNIGWVKFGGLSDFPDSSLGGNAKLEGGRVTGWARAVAGMSKAEYTSLPKAPIVKTVSTNSKETWIAYTAIGYGDYYVELSKLPLPQYTFAGETFIVYNPERMYTGGLENFKKNPQAAINSATVIPVGGNRGDRYIFNTAQLASESQEMQKSEIQNLKGSFHNRYACTTNEVDAPNCHRNNAGSAFPSIGYILGGPIYVTYHDSDGGGTMGEGEVIGTYDIVSQTSRTVIDDALATKTTSGSAGGIDNRGGWDGWISLGSAGTTSYGVTLSNGSLEGFAWGSDVIGWIDWANVKVTRDDMVCASANGLVVDGESTDIYTQITSGADAGKCQSQRYVCRGKTLSAVGSPGAPEACTISTDCSERDGITLKNGESYKFFKERIVSGTACVSANITCSNGVLMNEGGVADYDYTYKQCLSVPNYTEK